MSEQRNVLRWLKLGAALQLALIFLGHLVFTRKLSAVGGSLRDALYGGGVATEQVDKVNQAFSSISNGVYWIFLGGMVFTCVGFPVLSGIIKNSLQKPNPKTSQDSE